MKVYCVFHWVRYEGSELLGVFSTEKKASEYIDSLLPPRYSEVYQDFANGHTIETWEIDHEE